MTNKPSHDNSAVSEWKGELYNANLYIDLYKFPQRIKVKIMFLNFSLVFFWLMALSLRRRRSFWQNVPSDKVHWRNDCIRRLGVCLQAFPSFLPHPFPALKKRRACSRATCHAALDPTRAVRTRKDGNTCLTRQKRLRGRLSCPCSIDPQYKP